MIRSEAFHRSKGELEPLPVAYVAADSGTWWVDQITPVVGRVLPKIDRLAIVEGPLVKRRIGAEWCLWGVTSNLRYTTTDEHAALRLAQPPLGRPESTRAALIPVRKSAVWWELAQDERRAVFGEQSRHIGIGMEYMSAVARRLVHCRDVGQPFDFLTWFEYAPADAGRFEELVQRLRATQEWRFVEREVDIRLEKRA